MKSEEDDQQYFDLLNCINLRQFDGHRSEVTCATFSRDFDMLVTGSDDCRVRVYNTRSTAMVHDIEEHTEFVKSVAISNDTRYFASGSDDKTVCVYLTRTCDCLHTFQHKKAVESVVFMNDSKRLISGSWDQTVRVWDVQSGACLITMIVTSGASCLAVDCMDSVLAVGSWDKQVRLWHVPRDLDNRNLHKPAILKGMTGSVLTVAISSTNLVAAAGCSKIIYIWHVSHCKLLLQIDSEHVDWIVALAFSPDSKTLCSVSKHDTVKFWEADSGECSRRFDVIAENAYYCGFTQKGSAIIASCAQSSTAELMTYMWSTLRQTDNQDEASAATDKKARPRRRSDQSSDEDFSASDDD